MRTLVAELRAQEARSLLGSLDPLALQTRIRLAESTELLDILDGAPGANVWCRPAASFASAAGYVVMNRRHVADQRFRMSA